MRRMFLFLLVILIAVSANAWAFDTAVVDTFKFIPTKKKGIIEWKKFPEFNLPFNIIYGGPNLKDTSLSPLKHGFSHLLYEPTGFSLTQKSRNKVPLGNLAIVWYDLAYTCGNTPWANKIPWANDLGAYKTCWKNSLKQFAGDFPATQELDLPQADIMIMDIDATEHTRDAILGLRTNPMLPSYYANLDNYHLLLEYKKAQEKMYNQPYQYLKDQKFNPLTKISSWSDAPYYGNEFLFPEDSCKDFLKDSSQINFIDLDKDDTTFYKWGDVYNNQSFLTTHYYFPNDSNFVDDLLYNALFKIETNMYWSKKDLYLTSWLRYVVPDVDTIFIKPELAEALAIFPFFDGAKGFWLYDEPLSKIDRKEDSTNFAIYEQFIYGLYRLSLYKEYFSGKNEFIRQRTACELFHMHKGIWRAVVKNNGILIAAHNPYAKTVNFDTTLHVSYKSWSEDITLHGREIFLNEFQLPPYKVTFTIVNSDGKPMQGAKVKFGSYNISADTNGVVTTDLDNGDYKFTVTKAGYSTIADSSFTVKNKPLSIIIVIYPLKYAITLRVTDGTKPLDKAKVILGDSTKITNTLGTVQFNLINGVYLYSAEKDGYYGITDDSLTVSDAAFTKQVILKPFIYQITFNVNDGIGPIPDAEVRVLDSTHITNSSGDADFFLSNGNYTYSVTKTGFNNKSETFFVNSTSDSIKVLMSLVECVDEHANNDIYLFPNPNDGNFQFKVNNDYIGSSIEISDIFGTKIFSSQINSEINNINLSNSSNGLYLVKVFSKQKLFYFKIIIN